MKIFLLAYPEILYKPKSAMARIIEYPQSTIALVMFLIVAIVSNLIMGPSQSLSFKKAVATLPFLGTMHGQIIFGLGAGIILLAMMAGIFHVVSEMFGGKGNLRTTWTFMLVASTVFGLINRLPIPYIQWLTMPWHSILTVLFAMQAYGFRPAKAVGVVVVNMIAMVVVLTVSMLALISALAAITPRWH